MGNKELKKASESYFEKNKDLQEIFATTDGQFFFQENRANLHKNNLRDAKTGKSKISVVKITRTEALASDTTSGDDDSADGSLLDQSVKNIKAGVKEITDVDVLQDYIEEEDAKEKPRTSAIEAIQERITELTANA